MTKGNHVTQPIQEDMNTPRRWAHRRTWRWQNFMKLFHLKSVAQTQYLLI